MVRAQLILSGLLALANPSTHAECKAQTIQVGMLEEGQYSTAKIEGKILGIYKRTDAEISALRNGNDLIDGALDDSNQAPSWWPKEKMPPTESQWATSATRSPSPRYFVFYALAPIKTEEGACHVIHYPKSKPADFPSPDFYYELGPDWPGGFVDHCYGVGYDYSGRPVYSVKYPGYPALERLSKFNLIIPEYEITSAGDTLRICD